jgi:cell division protein ZapA
MRQPEVTVTRVDIFGQEYALRGQASEEHMRLVAALVNEKMQEIAQANPRFDLAKVAVLSAVNIADDYIKLVQEYNELLAILERHAGKP